MKRVMSVEATSSSSRLRLKNIKLAGFKSFVDPTVVPFPSNLVGVVGPNGCGKSNIIDAVRWVMGESSAKSLRAEAGTDVIFNGSTERKPVGQASIELVFDNPNGAIGGEYASYSEISIRRVINRDSISTYFLNNVRCRRKDITDIFLGTGMGPRSYSIIEQGMISRLIEAKPEDLRVYLEEAAGISKYKERRRETENRIKHTRENLERLNDLRDELDKQLARLQRQSQAAAKYKELKHDERIYKGQLLSLRWKNLSEQTKTLEQTIQQLSVELESQIAKQRSADHEIEQIREYHHEAQDAFQQVQEKFYGIGGQIARAEQSITHQQERREQLEHDLQEAEQNYANAKVHVEEDQHKIDELQSILVELEPEHAIAQEKMQQLQEALELAEDNMHQWQNEWDDFNSQSAKASEHAQVSQTQIQHLEQRINLAKQRIEKLLQEHERMSAQLNTDEVEQLHGHIDEQSAIEQDKQNTLDDCQAQIKQTRDNLRTTNDKVALLRNDVQKLLGRQASLEALQQAALGKNNDQVTQWLSANHLSDNVRLAQNLQVEQGWDIAVETVLGNYLQAVCIDDMGSIANVLDSLSEGELSFIVTSNQNTSSHSDSLASKVQGANAVTALLSNVFIANTLSEALQKSTQLAAHESVITPDGIWLGHGWLKVAKDKDQSQGVIKREQELNTLKQTLDEKQALLAESEDTITALNEQLQTLESNEVDARSALKAITEKLAAMRTEFKVKESRQEQVKLRIQQLNHEHDEQQSTIAQATEELLEVRSTWQEAMQLMEQQSDLRETLNNQKEQYRQALDNARENNRYGKDAFHDMDIQLRTATTELDNKKNNIIRMSTQLEHSTIRCESLRESLQESHEPITQLEVELESLLERRLEVEEELSEKRQQLEIYDEQLKQQESQRHEAERQAEQLRDQSQELKMRWQEQQVRANTIKEQLDETEDNLEELLANMPAEANETEWDQQLTTIGNRISRLGPINLAAIDEYETESERKVYMDKQLEDLVEALNLLEGAIQKIDKETRQKFKDTYEIVNSHFKQLFPKVFGGGSAYLALTGEDLLDTGVSVMARPPGKKNSTIHLLSGGEKALTAIALVFSIFQLNPAPFCMLDEVDAPLDDANVGRYCNLIKDMSKQVQFIFISHNKIAMEMAEQLTGVTMKEPGVSRMVSVDIDAAMAMAEA